MSRRRLKLLRLWKIFKVFCGRCFDPWIQNDRIADCWGAFHSRYSGWDSDNFIEYRWNCYHFENEQTERFSEIAHLFVESLALGLSRWSWYAWILQRCILESQPPIKWSYRTTGMGGLGTLPAHIQNITFVVHFESDRVDDWSITRNHGAFQTSIDETKTRHLDLYCDMDNLDHHMLSNHKSNNNDLRHS